MISPGAVIASVLPVYVLLLVGAILRKTGILKPENDAPMMRLVYEVMLPCYVLDKILGAEVLRSGIDVAWGLGLGFLLITSGILIGYLIGRLIRLQRGSGIRTFALSTGCQNFGFTAVPVVEILWGGGALAILFIHNIGVELAIWSIGVMIMSGEGGIPWKKLINGPVIAVILGLTLVMLGIDKSITGPPRVAMSMIGIGCFPLAIILTGASMIDLAFREKPSTRIILGSALVRLALAPAVILCAAKFLPLATELRQVLVVQAAMPAAMSPILLAKMYGGKPGVAVQVVIATTILSLLTLPWIVSWGSQWIGLNPVP